MATIASKEEVRKMTVKFSLQKKGRFEAEETFRKYMREVKQAMEGTLKDLNDEDIRRTRSGRDVKGRFFKPYTAAYAKRRQAKGLQVRPVNLTVTGSLLDGITNKVTIRGRSLFVTRAIPKDQQKKAEGLSKKRQFFGLSKKQDAIIRKALSRLRLREIF